jgi:hypothetical protein
MEAPPGFTLAIATILLLVNLSCAEFDIGLSSLGLPPNFSPLFGHCGPVHWG